MSLSLSKYFDGIGAKRLTEVEIKPEKSNQHEFNGVGIFKELFGTDKIKFNGKFIFLPDNATEIIEDEGALTWYDAREKHATRTEHRLYYTTNDVISSASAGDLLIIGKTASDSLAVIIAQKGSTSEQQLLWLFGLSEVEDKFILKDFSRDKKDLGFAGKYIISYLGFEPEEVSGDFLELILKNFGEKFPTTLEFSKFARETVKKVSPKDAPDETLLIWLEREELLFKTLESHLVQKKLKEGFGKKGDDVDEFVQFSLSVQNRRKSRAGLSFENHLAEVFNASNIKYSKKGKTENNYEPDFLFPGISQYHDSKFNPSHLTMLGVKTTAKERWRQILPEAEKIWPKHLITLEPSISKNQTDQMRSEKVQLVIPRGIIDTYNREQQKEILSLNDFIDAVQKIQNRI